MLHERVMLTQAPSPVFEARGLTKTYAMGEVELHALRGVDLSLQPGEFVVLLGASGSGKSTLLNLIGGLDRPSSGSLRCLGHDLAAAGEAELTRFRRDSVGFVFQFYNLIPSLTAQENVELVTDIAHDPIDPAEALSMVGLGHCSRKFPSQLSGGEQQRVAIARAIAKRPAILLCDEPTGALDSRTGVLVLEALERMHQEIGTLTILITHNAGIASMADLVIHMSDGMISHQQRNAHRRQARELSW